MGRAGEVERCRVGGGRQRLDQTGAKFFWGEVARGDHLEQAEAFKRARANELLATGHNARNADGRHAGRDGFTERVVAAHADDGGGGRDAGFQRGNERVPLGIRGCGERGKLNRVFGRAVRSAHGHGIPRRADGGLKERGENVEAIFTGAGGGENERAGGGGTGQRSGRAFGEASTDCGRSLGCFPERWH